MFKLMSDDEWTHVNKRLPYDGQEIVGMNINGKTWFEKFDKDEPLGAMVYWKPIYYC